MTEKRALLDELFPLLEANGCDAELLGKMRHPDWIERVSVANLEFMLRQQRELRALRAQNEGLYERWQRSKRTPGPGEPDG